MRKLQIDAKPRTLKELILLDKQYQVPSYQRLYSWDENHLNDFCESLEPLVEWATRPTKSGPPTIFFGPAVVEMPKGQGAYQVVDGQQRFTTFALLLSALRSFVYRNYADAFYDDDRRKGFDEWVWSQLCGRGGKPFLQPNKSLAPTFKEAIYNGAAWKTEDYWKDWDKNGPEVVSSMTQVAKNLDQLERFFEDKVIAGFGKWSEEDLLTPSKSSLQTRSKKEVEFLVRFIEAVLENCFFLIIEVANTSTALELFSSLNDKGLRLAPADIIKAKIYELGVENRDSSLDDLEFTKTWDAILTNLGDYDLNRFLRHWCMALLGTRIVQNEVVGAVTELLHRASKPKLKSKSMHKDEERKFSPEELLQELLMGSIEYKKALYPIELQATSDKQLIGPMQRMNLLGEYHRILVFKILSLRLPTSDKRNFLLQIEKYVARAAFAGQYPQERENLIVRVAGKIRKESNKKEVQSALKELFKPGGKASFPSDSEFKDALQSHCRELKSIDKKTRYVIFAYGAQFEMPGNSYFNADIDVEHIFPQSPRPESKLKRGELEKNVAPQSYWYAKLDMPIPQERNSSDYVSTISQYGNLVPLESYINRAIQDKNWNGKLEGAKDPVTGEFFKFANSHFKVTRELAKTKENQLDLSWLEKRTNEIIARLVKITAP